MTTLYVAAGGGGDALGALVTAPQLATDGSPPWVATFAWERLRLDPAPGPRGVQGFRDLGLVAGRPIEILPRTSALPAGRSALPRLARESDARLFLLDPARGATGLADQLCHLVAALGVERLMLIDVGGDVVARGDEVEVRSPLADGLAVAAAAATVDQVGLPADVVVAGPGLDGELPEATVIDRLSGLGGARLADVSETAARAVLDIFAWHPSEATALLVAAVIGIRGPVELRRDDIVMLTDVSPQVWSVSLTEVVQQSLIVRALGTTRSLAEADAVTRTLAVSELDYERRKAKESPELPEGPLDPVIDRVRRHARRSMSGGATWITTRRLAEAIDLPGAQTDQLVERLLQIPAARCGPLWDMRRLR